ncbi:trypsin-1-like [Bicyclus anynana]|uniref:Trypsin-1-like n=1 Tax=Bicyclus anynana TaxID=110368 RepID=A0ABM3LGF2_BICAN|nr:trypsin-1-like [Bicyclus anynana]
MKIDGINTRIISLAPSWTTVPAGTILTVSGWGKTTENGTVSSSLMAVRVPAVSSEDCGKSYNNIHMEITINMFCAGFLEGGKDSCQGDSGSAAVSDGIQRGIVSFGKGCARPGYPSVYTKTTYRKVNYLRKIIISDVLCKKHAQSNKTIDGKIVGGSEVSIKDYPYQAHLLIETDKGYYGCGGSIISNNYILTAAHCLPNAKKVYVRVGSDYADIGGEVIQSTDLKTHPKYNSKTSDFDVGLIRLPSNIVYDDTKRAIKLPAKGTDIPSGTRLIVSGWGATSENGDSSDVLLAVTVPTLTNARCRLSYRSLTGNMVCAGVPQGGKDSCQGDSGGPAVASSTQLGIVSFGVGCARPGFPGVYARVASPGIRDWIKDNSGV